MARRVIGDGFPTTLGPERRGLSSPSATDAAFASDRRALGAASDCFALRDRRC